MFLDILFSGEHVSTEQSPQHQTQYQGASLPESLEVNLDVIVELCNGDLTVNQVLDENDVNMLSRLSTAVKTKLGKWINGWTAATLTAVDECTANVSNLIKDAEVVVAITVIRGDELSKA